MFKLQVKDGPRSPWRDMCNGRRFDTVAQAQAYGRSLDQDGDWNPRAMRVANANRDTMTH